ncbi:MAG: PSD1 domain-containing protein [Planctomycetales bacterium]|nr:PSD1 domain-containing protein [Planctomycetales bacterium]
MNRSTFFSLVCMVTVFSFWNCEPSLANELPKANPVYFETDVRPILKVKCFHCHGELGETSGGLDLRLVRLMKSGGDSGTALDPSDGLSSLLWERIASDEMPEGPKKLTDEEKSTIQTWLQQGAPLLRTEPDNVEDARFTIEELQHWAFQPVKQPDVPHAPQATTEIDSFLLHKLQQNGLRFSPAADKRTLVRRIYLDVIGLPPTEQQVADFINDTSDNAYAKLIDQLVASDQFGVRWARHWLDAAGYAESNGGPLNDTLREFAWRYRDYVVDAFNQNMPIDQFIREQLAGDEMLSEPPSVDNPEHLRLLTATGFLRLAPDPSQAENNLANRNMAVADSLQTISTALTGITVGCAQCHDHKYDPIGIDDYYRFRSIFDPAFPLDQWQTPNARLIDMTPPDVQAQIDQIEAEAKALEDKLKAERDAVALEIQERKLADVPQDVREATRAAVKTAPNQRSAEQNELLDTYPMVKPIPTIIGLLVEYDSAQYRHFEKEFQKVADIRATKPLPHMIMATTETSHVPVSKIFFRGNPEDAQQTVSPAEITVLARLAPDLSIPENNATLPTTGRRLAYAQYLTSGHHPLTARVFVNRIWMHYFGQGLVTTPGDFGLNGQRPSHPELLDWLADSFVQSGWNHKQLHRMILLSAAYQQTSVRSAAQDAIDPDNQLLGRMTLKRMDAETLRDALYHVSGQLNLTLGGPSVPVTEDSEGKAVIGKRQIKDGLKAGVASDAESEYRRSLYIQVQRKLPLDMLATFDQPVMNPNCHCRPESTVATQALWFLNDALAQERALALTGELWNELPDKAAEISYPPLVRRLYVRLFACEPSAEELAKCVEFLETLQPQLVAVEANDRRRQAFCVLTQTLFASNRFLYIE